MSAGVVYVFIYVFSGVLEVRHAHYKVLGLGHFKLRIPLSYETSKSLEYMWEMLRFWESHQLMSFTFSNEL